MRPRPTRRAVLVGSAAAIAGCTTGDRPRNGRRSPPENPSWPMFGYDAANTGYNAVDVGPRDGVEKRWHAGVRGYYTLSTPVVVDGTIYLGSGQYLYAIDADGGDRQWSTWLGALSHHFSPAVREGVVYVGARGLSATVNGEDERGTLFAVDGETGAVEWEVETHLASAPVVDGNAVYLSNAGGDRGYVGALDPSTGESTWETTVERGPASGVFSAPAVVDGRLYVTATAADGPAGSVLALDADDGRERWRTALDGRPASMPVVSDGTVFLATAGGTVLAVDASTGERTWSHDAGDRLYTAPAVADGTVYVARNGTVIAVDAGTGEVRWHNSVEEDTRTGLSVVDGSVYAGGNSLYALSGDDGALEWQVNFDGVAGTFGTPSVVGGMVYSGTCVKPTPQSLYDNYVYAVGEA